VLVNYLVNKNRVQFEVVAETPPFSGRRGNAEVLADLLRQVVLNLSVAGNSGPAVLLGVVPPRMAAALAEEGAAVGAQVLEQLAPLQTAISTSAKFSPAAWRASSRFISRASRSVT